VCDTVLLKVKLSSLNVLAPNNCRTSTGTWILVDQVWLPLESAAISLTRGCRFPWPGLYSRRHLVEPLTNVGTALERPRVPNGIHLVPRVVALSARHQCQQERILLDPAQRTGHFEILAARFPKGHAIVTVHVHQTLVEFTSFVVVGQQKHGYRVCSRDEKLINLGGMLDIVNEMLGHVLQRKVVQVVVPGTSVFCIVDSDLSIHHKRIGG
jgi:hypothetical protein